MRESLTHAQTQVTFDVARYGAWAAVALVLLTVAWIVSLGIAPAPAPDASASERLAFIADHDGWQILNFATVVPMGLLHVPVWLGLAAMVWSVRPAISVLISAFGLLYAPFTVIGYWTQLTTVRGLVDLSEREPERAAAALEVIGFTGDPWSASYGIVVLGYGVWGIAALAVYGGLRDAGLRLARVVAVLFGVAGVLAIVGAGGFVAGSALLEVGVLLSGVVFLPALIGAAVLLNQFSSGSIVTVDNK